MHVLESVAERVTAPLACPVMYWDGKVNHKLNHM